MTNMLMNNEVDKDNKDIKYMYHNSYTQIYHFMIKHHCDIKRFNFTWMPKKNILA